MASSKECSNEVVVPAAVIGLSSSFPGVVCNLRPSQRTSEPSTSRNHPRYGDGQMISDDFERFLDHLKSPIMAVILYQDYGVEIFTVVVQLEPVICWTNDGLPRLEFEKPSNWNHCINMWGGFVLAISPVQGIGPTNVVEDASSEHFVRIVRQFGV